MKEINLLTSRMLIGHADDDTIMTGCTVFLFPHGAIGGVDVRGGAPGSHETDVLRNGNLVQEIHGLVFTGGSAFGLASIPGVMRYLYENKIGFDTGHIRVPIIPGAVIYDIPVGEKIGFPDQHMGYQASQNASTRVPLGKVGAGKGATIGKILGYENAMDGGFGGYFHYFDKDHWVGGFVVVNSLGDVVNPGTGAIVAGAKQANGEFLDTRKFFLEGKLQNPFTHTNTTLGLVVTNMTISKEMLNRIASIAQDGIARVIRPAHTQYDGDIIFAVSLKEQPVPYDISVIGETATYCMEKAILTAVQEMG